MHNPSTVARPSIYYHYQVFKPWLSSAHGPLQSKHESERLQPRAGVGSTGAAWGGEGGGRRQRDAGAFSVPGACGATRAKLYNSETIRREKHNNERLAAAET